MSVYTAKVDVIPKCNFCERPALYDAKMHQTSKWGFVCQRHFDDYGIGLGLGLGQILIQRSKDDRR